MVTLKKFRLKDAQFIIDNFPTYFKTPTIEFVSETLNSWQKGKYPDGGIVLAYCIVYEGVPVGLITLTEKAKNTLSFGIMIKEEYRKKGIATKAFNIAKQNAKNKGITKIISSCAKSNMASFTLHQKLGFSLIKEEVNLAGNLMCRWEMNL